LTETVSRGLLILFKNPKGWALLLEEEGKVQIIDDTEEAPPTTGATGRGGAGRRSECPFVLAV
jgi:hypothetical protein